MNKKLIFSVLGVLAIAVAGVVFYQYNSVKTNIEHPIILVSGYGSKAKLWEKEDAGLVEFLEKKGLKYGGVLYQDAGSENQIRPQKELKDKYDVFTMAYSDSTADVDVLAKELSQVIDYVLDYTKADKVMIVSYSMGGIVSRKYLVDHVKDGKVATLVSITTPHKGTSLASFAGFLSNFFQDNKWVEASFKLIGVPIDGKSLNNLETGDDSYVEKLNGFEHPMDVNYCSIIGYLGSWVENDLVASIESQDMKNIEFFQENPGARLCSHKISGVYHLDILEKHDEIYDILKNYISFRDNSRH